MNMLSHSLILEKLLCIHATPPSEISEKVLTIQDDPWYKILKGLVKEVPDKYDDPALQAQ